MRSKFSKFYPLLSQISQFKQTFLKLLSLLRVFIKFANLFFANDLSLKSPLDNIPPDLFDAINKQAFQVSPLDSLINILRLLFFDMPFQPLISDFDVFYGLGVVGLQGLDVGQDFIFHIFFLHFRIQDQVYEFLEFNVFCWHVPITRDFVQD